MIVFGILYAVISAIWLAYGLRGKNAKALAALNVLWWLGSFGSAYFTYLAWQDRAFSENWAIMGFVFMALPFAVLTIIEGILLLIFISKWTEKPKGFLRWSPKVLIAFLVAQLVFGFYAGR